MYLGWRKQKDSRYRIKVLQEREEKTISMLYLLLKENKTATFHFRQVTQVLTMAFFFTYVFLEISSRWIH